MKYKRALDIVENCFRGKTDKVGVPYIEHCLFVSEKAFKVARKYNPSFSDDCRLVGLLHDVIEDCEVPLDGLFSDFVVDTVKLLSRKENESYSEYFRKILESNNFVALVVKFCDSCHNSDVTRYPKEMRTEEIRKRCKKYKKRAKKLLTKILR